MQGGRIKKRSKSQRIWHDGFYAFRPDDFTIGQFACRLEIQYTLALILANTLHDEGRIRRIEAGGNRKSPHYRFVGARVKGVCQQPPDPFLASEAQREHD